MARQENEISEEVLQIAMERISRETGIPVTRIACCPTAGKDGVPDRRGIVVFDDDDPEKRPLVILPRERIGEPASVSKQP